MRRDIIATIALLLAPTAATAQPAPLVPVEHRGVAPAPFPVSAATPDLMAAHFINVGQGSAALFEFSCGLVLIDTGGQSEGPTDWQARLGTYLDGVFARRPELGRTLDVVYLTHPHPDHILGVKRLIEPTPYVIRHVITDAEKAVAGQKKLIEYANRNQIPVAQITTNQITGRRGLWSRYIDPLRCRVGGDPDIIVLWGSFDQRQQWSQKDAKNENNHSVAVRIKFGDSTFLVTGDMQERSIRAMLAKYAANRNALNVDVYVAGHHGSHNGTTEELMRKTTPEIAVISAGDPGDEEPGRFTAYHHGHPHRQAFDLMANLEFGVTLRRPPVAVAIGTKGASFDGTRPGEYVRETIDRAIFSTGWDGDIVIVADHSGTKKVIID